MSPWDMRLCFWAGRVGVRPPAAAATPKGSASCQLLHGDHPGWRAIPVEKGEGQGEQGEGRRRQLIQAGKVFQDQQAGRKEDMMGREAGREDRVHAGPVDAYAPEP